MSEFGGKDWAEGMESVLTRDLMEIAHTLDVLPDGQEAIVIGDVHGDQALFHPQGENPYGFHDTSGLVSCEGVLRQFGMQATEGTVLDRAIELGLCSISENPAHSGGTTPAGQAALLTDMGIPAHIEQIGALEELAQSYEHGHGVIASVNAGRMWDDVRHYDWGHPNHAVLVTGAARSPSSGEVLGVFTNDSGRGVPGDSGRFVDALTMETSLIDAGGTLVVTDVVRPPANPNPVAGGSL